MTNTYFVCINVNVFLFIFRASSPQNTASDNVRQPSKDIGHAPSGDLGENVPGKRPMMAVCFFMNFGLSLMIAANAVFAMGHKSNVGNAGILFVGAYMIIFSFFLGIYELIQLCPIEALDLTMKKNLGFLYGAFGKCAYLIL